MRAISLPLVIGTLYAFTLPAAAAPLVLDFAFERDGYTAVLDDARRAGVEIDEFNYGTYAYTGDGLVLGNDGLSNWATFAAVTGRIFDVLTVDLRSLRGQLTELSCAGIETFPDPDFPGETLRCDDPDALYFAYDTLAALSPPVTRQPNLIFDGYRGTGAPVATAILSGPAPGLLDIAALGDFTGLTRLVVSVTDIPLGGFDWTFNPVSNAWIWCDGGASCGLARIDSLALNLRAPGTGGAAPVPLPAAAGLLGAAIAGLGTLRAVQRRTVWADPGPVWFGPSSVAPPNGQGGMTSPDALRL